MAADGRHGTQLRNHIIEAFSFASAANRAAGTTTDGYVITSSDVGKIGYDTDTGAYTRLTAFGPPLVWAYITGVSGTSAPADAYYLTRRAESGLSAEFDLSSVSQGVLAHSVSGGVSTPRRGLPGVEFYQPGSTDVAVADGGTGASTASAARTNLGLVIGTDVAAQSSVTSITGNNQTGTTYTFVLTDAGKVVEGNNGSAITFTIPPVSSVAWPVGTVIEVFQQGAGKITIAAGSGVTLRSDGGKVAVNAQYGTIGLRMRANDEWVLSGDLV